MKTTRLEVVLTAIIAVICLWYLPAQITYRVRHPRATETEIWMRTKDVLLFRREHAMWKARSYSDYNNAVTPPPPEALFEAGYHAGQLSTLPVVTIRMDTGGYISGAHFDLPVRFEGEGFIVTRCGFKWNRRRNEEYVIFDLGRRVLVSHCRFEQDLPLEPVTPPWRN